MIVIVGEERWESMRDRRREKKRSSMKNQSEYHTVQ
jgi:hypothetical protein